MLSLWGYINSKNSKIIGQHPRLNKDQNFLRKNTVVNFPLIVFNKKSKCFPDDLMLQSLIPYSYGIVVSIQRCKAFQGSSL